MPPLGSQPGPLPIGLETVATPRPLPARIPIRSRYVTLKPLHRRHIAELWQPAQSADAIWTCLHSGPFATAQAMARAVMDLASTHDPIVWVARPASTGASAGWLALSDIQPKDASIEPGDIGFSPGMRCTRETTEAIFPLQKLAADDLGYRRPVWKCNTSNEPSKRMAERFGFTYEGLHRLVKVRERDTDWYSIVGGEWRACRDMLLAWLVPSNFAADGAALSSLADLRRGLA
jgi:RimJ/RimL family protein N-acetyltransferase